MTINRNNTHFSVKNCFLLTHQGQGSRLDIIIYMHMGTLAFRLKGSRISAFQLDAVMKQDIFQSTYLSFVQCVAVKSLIQIN